MLVVYDSLTGMGKKVALKLSNNTVDINTVALSELDSSMGKTILPVNEKVFLLTRSFNFGEIPITTLNFLNVYKSQVVGTGVSGNRNWGANFGAAGHKIEEQFDIPLVCKFEGLGFSADIQKMNKFIINFKG